MKQGMELASGFFCSICGFVGLVEASSPMVG